MRVLGRPDRLETALLQRAGKLRRRHRIIGKEHRAAEMHVPLPCWVLVRRRRLARGADRRYRLAILSHAVHANRVLPWPTSGRGLAWGPQRAPNDQRPRRAASAKSSISIWTRSTRRWNS